MTSREMTKRQFVNDVKNLHIVVGAGVHALFLCLRQTLYMLKGRGGMFVGFGQGKLTSGQHRAEGGLRLGAGGVREVLLSGPLQLIQILVKIMKLTFVIA